MHYLSAKTIVILQYCRDSDSMYGVSYPYLVLYGRIRHRPRKYGGDREQPARKPFYKQARLRVQDPTCSSCIIGQTMHRNRLWAIDRRSRIETISPSGLNWVRDSRFSWLFSASAFIPVPFANLIPHVGILGKSFFRIISTVAQSKSCCRSLGTVFHG